MNRKDDWLTVTDILDDLGIHRRTWQRWRELGLTPEAIRLPKIVRQVLSALALKLDGTAASPDYLGRRRRVLYNILKYAVREGRLTENPLDTTEWEPSGSGIDEINPRVVASPEQVRQLLTAFSHVGPRRGARLVGFFACLYFAMLHTGLCQLRRIIRGQRPYWLVMKKRPQ